MVSFLFSYLLWGMRNGTCHVSVYCQGSHVLTLRVCPKTKLNSKLGDLPRLSTTKIQGRVSYYVTTLETRQWNLDMIEEKLDWLNACRTMRMR